MDLPCLYSPRSSSVRRPNKLFLSVHRTYPSLLAPRHVVPSKKGNPTKKQQPKTRKTYSQRACQGTSTSNKRPCRGWVGEPQRAHRSAAPPQRTLPCGVPGVEVCRETGPLTRPRGQGSPPGGSICDPSCRRRWEGGTVESQQSKQAIKQASKQARGARPGRT